MSTSDTKLNNLCDNLDDCKLDAEKKISDEELFKQPPPQDDCPICFLRIPSLATGRVYKSCCGKVICSGCSHAPVYDNQGNKVIKKKCPFCRTPHPKTDNDLDERDRKRAELDDPIAIYNIGCDYRDGAYGYAQNYTKALELWHRAGELGLSKAYGSIGYAYNNGRGVEVDLKKANHCYKLAAMMGNEIARYNLGIQEKKQGNYDRAMKHFIIAVRGGQNESLEAIKLLYLNGHATKDDYMKALRSYQAYLGEIKSVQRDKAAAADERYQYY